MHNGDGGGGWKGWRQWSLVSVAVGLFMGLAGPFGSERADLTVRVIYWVALMVAGSILSQMLSSVVFARGRFARRAWLGSVVIALVFLPLYVVVVWLTTSILFVPPLRLSTLPGFIGPVGLVTAAMTGISILTRAAFDKRRAAAEPAAVDPAPAKLLQRLPLRLRGAEIHAVQSEDHYLRVHTDRGSDLILMRLSDAVEELKGIDGARTHRSWWVAKSAVMDVKRNDGRAELTLKGDLKVPVSRAHARILREQGWW